MKALLPLHLNKVGAGFPSPATDYVEDDIDLNNHLIKNIPSTFLIRAQEKSINSIGIQLGLKEYGIQEADIPNLSKLAFEDSCHATHPFPVTMEDFTAVYTRAL